MMFTAREIKDTESLGYFLRTERERRGFSIAQIARKTMIDERYIMLLEENKFDKLPGVVYCKHFIKRYAEILGFTQQEVLQYYEQDLKGIYEQHVHGITMPRVPIARHVFITWPKIFRTALVSCIALIVFGYLGFSAYTFLEPPDLTVSYPADNIVVPAGSVSVAGATDDEALVTINGVPVVVEDGVFSHVFDVQGGVNTFEIIASKKHGRKRVLTRQVFASRSGDDLSKQ